MKSKTLNILVSSIFVLFLVLSLVFYIVLYVTKQDLYLVIATVCVILMIGVPGILAKCIKIDVIKELEESDSRTIQQEVIYQFLRGNFGTFLSLDEYDTEKEVYTNYANIGYIKKEYDDDPHYAIYIRLFRQYFEIRCMNTSIKKRYDEFNSVEEIFASIKENCNIIENSY